MVKLLQLVEPTLKFGHQQSLEHPKDGLTLFGPYTRETPGSVRFGVIGTAAGIETFQKWSAQFNYPLPAYKGSRFTRRKASKYGKLSHQFFPGFESAFDLKWNHPAEKICIIPDQVLEDALKVHDLHTRISRTAKIYAKRLTKLHFESENKPDFWFVVVPKHLERLCRPESEPPKDYLEGTRAEDASQFGLFVDQITTDSFAEEYAEALKFKPDFHNQLKARLLKNQIITQVVQSETLEACLRPPEEPVRDKEDPATISWNLATSIYYKTRRRPWILSDIREGICYMGIVFKRLSRAQGENNACCGAQMFLEDGHGMVFKGALGPWYSEDKRECHLDQDEAAKLLDRALLSYADEHGNSAPKEIFVHGSVRFNEDEWAGFQEAAQPYGTKVVGVRIRKVSGGLKLMTRGSGAVMRGTALVLSENKAFLFTSGYTPRLNTYPGWNTPNPLDIEICNGEADIEVVLNDIMKLSKLNYNSCKFSDGFPITLKFAGMIGDILTTSPPDPKFRQGFEDEYKPLPFWHYI